MWHMFYGPISQNSKITVIIQFAIFKKTKLVQGYVKKGQGQIDFVFLDLTLNTFFKIK